MGKRLLAVAVAVSSLTPWADALAMERPVPKGVILFDAGRAEWTPGGGPGSVRAPVYGDPSRTGPYLHAIKVPPRTVSRAHSYSDARSYTVVSGTWYVGFGRRYEESELVALPAGSHYEMPAGVAVFNATREDGATILIGGTGPTRHVDVER